MVKCRKREEQRTYRLCRTKPTIQSVSVRHVREFQ